MANINLFCTWISPFRQNKLLLKFFCIVLFVIVTIYITMKSSLTYPLNNRCSYKACFLKDSNNLASAIYKKNARTEITFNRKKYTKGTTEKARSKIISGKKNLLLSKTTKVESKSVNQVELSKVNSYRTNNNAKKKIMRIATSSSLPTKSLTVNFKPDFNQNVLSKTFVDEAIRYPFFKTAISTNSVPWHKQPDKFLHLNENIVYKKFSIPRAIKLERVNVIFIVSSAPSRVDRRDAIRQTWWKQCQSTSKLSIKCVFLTDSKDQKSDTGIDLLSEARKYGDIHFQNLTGGYDFGMRFLYHMVWAMQNFDFDYFVRADDDYFLCMKRFLNEIPMPPKKLYHWGWVHCELDLVRPEESLILLSRDVIEIFLGQDPENILCHRWADQMIGIWVKNLHLATFHYRHDVRLHHDPPAAFLPNFKTEKSICTKYIGVHGSYPAQMRTLWNHRGPSNYDKSKTLDHYSFNCWYSSYMNWQLFYGEWKAKPKLCKADPSWGGPLGTTYVGRQGQ